MNKNYKKRENDYMLSKLLEEIMLKIIESNAKNNIDSIPHSDVFRKNIISSMGILDNQLNQILNILKESHRIFIFEIIKENKEKEIKKIEGYVEANLGTINRLKTFFQNLLMTEYEKKFNKRLLVHQIIKEIYQQRSIYQNTPIGQIGNKAIMLEEFSNLIEKHYGEYTAAWQENKLKELLEKIEQTNQENQESQERAPEEVSRASRRAIDTKEFSEIAAKGNKESLKRILSIYGVEFFFRVNLRKYNFDIIQAAIESGEIDHKADLKMLKEMIQKVKLNIKKDPKLMEYSDELYKLERATSRGILTSIK